VAARNRSVYRRKQSANTKPNNKTDNDTYAPRKPDTKKIKDIRLETAEIKSLRRLAGKTLLDQERSANIRRERNTENINERIYKRKQEWNHKQNGGSKSQRQIANWKEQRRMTEQRTFWKLLKDANLEGRKKKKKNVNEYAPS